MLLKITDSCDMGCTHCLSSCVPTENFMSMETLQKSIDWIKKTMHNTNVCIIVTGGEPTKHPDFVKVMEILVKEFHNTAKDIITGNIIVIATNGEWILKNKETAKYIADLSDFVEWQITTDSRYYPRQIDCSDPIWDDPRFVLCVNPIQKVYPLGRALENNIGEDFKCSQCYNMRALCSDLGGCRTVREAIFMLQIHMKFCQPQIQWNGDIAIGESNNCPAIGTVDDDDKTIYNAIRAFSHCKCDYINEKLPEINRKAINL